MIAARDAQKFILQHVVPLASEQVALDKCLRRFISSPIRAPIDLPVFDNAAMDGFPVRSEDLQKWHLRVVGAIFAGSVYPTPLNQHEALRIMTGAPLPAGADAVIPFEDTIFDADTCRVSRPVIAGENVRRTGEDIRRGDVALAAGQRIGASVAVGETVQAEVLTEVL